MTAEPAETSGDDSSKTSPAAPAPLEKRHRRGTLSTGFSEVPGKTCPVCGFQGFRWQTKCPEGHSLD